MRGKIGGSVLALMSALVAKEGESRPKVACTLPTIEAIAREIGGDRIETFSLAAGDQDPHFVSPTPSLMNRVRSAGALLELGMQLEIWADDVANGSGNPKLFRGAAGRVAVASGIPKLEVPAVLSRAQGDIHPEGNPHLWLDPMRAKMMAENVAKALATIAPGDASYFAERKKDFQQRVDRAFFGDDLLALVGTRKLSRLVLDGSLHQFLDTTELDGKKLRERTGGWLARAASLRGRKVVEFHRVWAYFAQAFGMTIVGDVEEKPGIQPGPRHLEELSGAIRREGVTLVLVDNFYDPGSARRVAQGGGARVVVLPSQVGGEKGVATYFDLIDHIVGRLTARP
ncbi:MAG: metal ABC transporter substrate-binding protein [Myxococcota bacterium]|mgnify:CR=1 FL=1